jgi:hypothetical protein
MRRHLVRARADRGRRKAPAWAAAALLFAAVTSVGGSAAEAVPAATLDVSATARLPQFPCFLSPGPCTGVVDGSAAGVLAGSLPDGGGWSVALADAEVAGSLTYVHGIDCTTGNGMGSLTVTAAAGDGLAAGTVASDDGTQRGVGGFRLHADFTLTQAGTQAEVFVANGTVALDVEDEGWVEVATGLRGAGVTTYLPDLAAVDAEECSWLLGRDAPPADVTLAGTIGLVGS